LAVDLDARRVRDDKRFAGLHDIHEAPAARLAIDVDLGSWALSATLQSRLAAPRQGGTTLVADLTWTLVAGNAGQLGLGLTGRLMDSWHARNFLSVDAGQSAASGLPGYRADAGLLEAGPLLQGLLRLNDDWALFGRASFGRLGSQGAGSPLVRSKANTVLIFSASRPF
jgi:outer membrane protein